MWKRIHLLHCKVKQKHCRWKRIHLLHCMVKHSIVLFKDIRTVYSRFVRLGYSPRGTGQQALYPIPFLSF